MGRRHERFGNALLGAELLQSTQPMFDLGNLAVFDGLSAGASSDIEVLFDGLPGPIDLALDLTTRTMYWTDRGDPPRGNTVNRARMDSAPGRRKDPEIVFTHLMEGIGLALDIKNQRIFMSDFAGSVYSARLDGSNRRLLLFAQGNVTGIAYAELPVLRSHDGEEARWMWWIGLAGASLLVLSAADASQQHQQRHDCTDKGRRSANLIIHMTWPLHETRRARCSASSAVPRAIQDRLGIAIPVLEARAVGNSDAIPRSGG